MLTNEKSCCAQIDQSESSATHPELILTSVVYSADISWTRTLDTLWSLSLAIQRGRGRLEDREDPPPFITFVVLSDFETLQNFFLTDCGPIQGVTFHEYSLKYSNFPISLSPLDSLGFFLYLFRLGSLITSQCSHNC